jgi:hypothetical protein
MPEAPHCSMRSAARAAAIVLTVFCVAACSIRQDASGTARTGILLWGFGDPPGVNWNLDRPRREVPDLPASPRPELPPRAVEPVWQSSDARNAELHAGGLVHPRRCAPSLREGAILPWGGAERSMEYLRAPHAGIRPWGGPAGAMEYLRAPHSGIRPWGDPAGSCDRRNSAIGDNRTRVPAFPSDVAGPVAVRALPRPLVPDHG